MSNQLSAEILSNFVGAIYDCVLAPQQWTQVIDALRSEFSFAYGSLGINRMPGGETIALANSGFDSASLDKMLLYDAEIVELWGGHDRIGEYPLGEPILLSQAMGPSSWKDNRYYVEWAAPRGLVDSVAIGIARDPTMVASLTFGRHGSAGPVNKHNVDGLRFLAPHIRRAVTISNVFALKAVEVATFASAMESFASGIILIDRGLQIIHANRAAEAMLKARDPIHSSNGRLSLIQKVGNDALAIAVCHAAEDETALGQRGIDIPAPSRDGDPYVLHVFPLNKGEIRPGVMKSAVCAVFVVPGASPPRLPMDALVILYQLTPAEARIFELICEGKTQAEISHSLGVAPSTVKTHLLRVFEKTGCNRQVDLVRLAASLSMPY